ncbi:hypothetical protein FHS83_003742 [Rhizomicrobium palustre]|uniref:Uncharacterized protein n=1 Tax=Rhizomicrobium palustre TaxID=189966 RepID=A0A846N330_9PROT|nr:hypothetical protein [Rhizomicrobium palustre]NIK90424.1 hypothetical protein [Rhizomicrobium palustre]
MQKTAALATAAALLFSATAGATPITDWKEVSKVAGAIPTAAGAPLLKRMESCKMKIHKDTSWIETRNVAWRDYGAKPGDTVLKLVFDVPPVPKQPGPTAPNLPQLNVVAVWVISKGKASPLSTWANALQNRPVPLGYDDSNNC